MRGELTVPDFVPGLEGVIAFETQIAEPDRDGSVLRYRGVDIEELVGRVSFGNVTADMTANALVASRSGGAETVSGETTA